MTATLDPILQALLTRLVNAHSQPPTDELVLDKNTIGAVGTELITLIKSNLLVETITLKGAGISITSDADTQTITVDNGTNGYATQPILRVAVPEIVAIFGIDNAKLTLLMTITVDTGWSPSLTFPNLYSQTYFENINLINNSANPVQFILDSQEKKDAQGNVIEEPELDLRAKMILSGFPTDAIMQLVSATASPIQTQGRMVANSTKEELGIVASIDSFSLPLPIISKLQFNNPTYMTYGSFEAISYPPAKEVYLRVMANVTLAGNILPLAVQMPSTMRGWLVMLIPGKTVPLSNLLGFLGAFISLDLASYLPEKIKILNVFELQQFILELNTDLNDIQKFRIGMGTNSAQSGQSLWKILPGVLELKDLGFNMTISKDSSGSGYNTIGTVVGSIDIGNTLTSKVQITLPPSAGNWIFTIASIGILPNLIDLTRFIGGKQLADLLPAALGKLTSFELYELTLTYNPSKNALTQFFLSFGSTESWVIIQNQLVIKYVFMAMTIDNPLGASSGPYGKFGGLLELGTTEIQVAVARSDSSAPWELTVTSDSLALPTLGDLTALVSANLSNLLPSGLQSLYFSLDDLLIAADITNKQLKQVNLTIAVRPQQTGKEVPTWVIIPNVLEVKKASVTYNMSRLDDTPQSVVIIYGGLVVVGIQVGISATRSTNGDWDFAGQMAEGESVDVIEMVTQFLEIDSAYKPPSLKIQDVAVTFGLRSAPKKTPYSLAGAIKGNWDMSPVDGINLSMEASAFFQQNEDGTREGNLTGTFKIGDFKVAASYQFNTISTTYGFLIAYKALELSATLTNKPNAKTPSQKDKILTVHFPDLSLGDMLDYLVNIANPRVTVKLSSPWDILYDINFKNLVLTVNMTTGEVDLDYKIDLQLVFAYIDTIGLAYVKENGKGKVKFRITGRFLDQEFTSDDPLTWDAIDDDPPAVPGKESAFLKLRYLGLGQHVAIDKPGEFNSVEEVIDSLRQNMLPVEGDENPLAKAHGLKFDENSHWLFGLDMTVIGTVRLAIVFNDPNLYGLLLELSGERAGALGGLKFEILYVKITDDIGVFKIELRVPDAFRQLEFGEVSITLPVIKLEIYTNGNFKVDLGFPHHAVFTDSFCVQVFPFIGYGGLYFAYLNGATSKRVPQISNGTFDPVIELGLGLSLGLGKDIEKGPLKAGLTLTVIGIMEGALAWFNPDDKSLPAPMYYWMQGTVAIVGKLWGKVDFVVISVDISVIAYASVTVTIEAYQPILIEMKVGVEVKASIKVLFIRIHFSFSLELHEKFTIGHATTPPWTIGQRSNSGGLTTVTQAPLLASSSIAPMTFASAEFIEVAAPKTTSNPKLRMQESPVKFRKKGHHVARKKMMRTAMIMATQAPLHSKSTSKNARKMGMATAVVVSPSMSWNTALTFPSKQDVNINMMPTFSVADPSTLLNGAGTNPVTVSGMSLYLDNSIPVNATSAEEAKVVSIDHSSRATSADDTAFNILVRGMLGYVMQSFTRASMTSISISDLELIKTLLSSSDAEHNGFSYLNVTEFISNNYKLEIIGTPAQSFPGVTPAITANGPSETSGTIFPMIPELSMGTPDISPAISFLDNTSADDAYEQAITAYFNQLSIDATANVAVNPLSQQNGTSPPIDTESVAQFVFRDYFMMIAKSAIQEGIDLMTSYSYPFETSDSLWSIANNKTLFPRVEIQHEVQIGETLHAIAKHFSMTDAEISLLNPGVPLNTPLVPPKTINVTFGVTVDSIALANKDIALVESIKLTLDDIYYQVKSQDTLTEIATPYDQQTAVTVGTLPANANNIELLQDGQLFTIAQVANPTKFTYKIQIGDHIDFIAAWFMVRNDIMGSVEQNRLNWYRQTIADLTPEISFDQNPNLDPSAALPLGTVVNIPISYNDSTPSTVTPYTSKSGDLITEIAGYFALTQDTTPPADFTKFITDIKAINPQITNWTTLKPDDPLFIPKLDHKLTGTDTINRLASLFGVPANDLVGVNSTNPNILTPLAVVTIPSFDHTVEVGSGDTLSKLANNYNITVDRLGEIIETIEGIFLSIVPKNLITIPYVPQLSVAQLETDVVNNGHSNKIAAMVSRFMLHGLRLPAPTTPISTEKLYSLYDITGQQFIAPASVPAGSPWNIEFTNPKGDNWINFFTSYVIQTGDKEGDVQAAFPKAKALNPNFNWGNIASEVGSIIFTDTVTGLTIPITNETVSNDYPSTTFNPTYNQPTKLALYKDQGVHYSLQGHLHWQTAIALAFPNQTPANTPTTGEPSLWIFPTSLVSKINNSAIASQNFELKALTENAVSPTTPAVELYMWATIIEFQVRIVADPNKAGSTLPNSYEILGASNTDRDRLRQLWDYLSPLPATETTPAIHLLYPPNATSKNSNGLISDNIETDKTFLLKTNLSTDTSSGSMSLNTAKLALSQVAVSTDPYASGISDSVLFMQYLWEACITGSGGYYLNYANKDGGEGIPSNAFDESGQANVRMVVALASQSKASTPSRRLFNFNNCAIIGDNIDPTGTNVFAQVAGGADQIRVANVPAGTLGWEMKRTEPIVSDWKNLSPATKTDLLYNLVGYSIKEEGAFNASHEGMPIGPLEPADIAGGDSWYYHQAVPISKLAKTHALPVCEALPLASNDPYAGIHLDGSNKLEKATFQFSFHDVLGNKIAPSTPIQNQAFEVGYFDEVIGLAQWPGLSAHYEITGVAGSPQLDLDLNFEVTNYVPGPGLQYDKAIYNASAHIVRYQQIYYQINQSDVSFQLSTSLQQISKKDAIFNLNKGTIIGFVNSVYSFLASVQQMTGATHEIVDNGTQSTSETLADISAGYSVSLDDLGTANTDKLAVNIFKNRVQIPYYFVVGQGQTLNAIVTESNKLSPASPITALSIVNGNTNTQLKPKVELSFPERSATINTTLEEATSNTLLKIATSEHISVAQLATYNASPTKSIISEGIQLSLVELSYTTVADDSFENITTQFNTMGSSFKVGTVDPYTIADVAVANENVPNLIVENADININSFLVSTGDTFAKISKLYSTYTASAFIGITSNLLIKGVFLSSNALYLFKKPQTPFTDDTMSIIASTYGITVNQLFAHNEDTQLSLTNHNPAGEPVSNTLNIPGLVDIGQSLGKTNYVPYAVQSTDTFGAIASRFFTTADPAYSLAQLNQYVSWLFADNQPIKVGANAVNTQLGDSMQSIIKRFKTTHSQTVTLQELSDTIKGSTNILAINAFLAATLPSNGAPKSGTSGAPSKNNLSHLKSDYNVSVEDLAVCNGALQNFLNTSGSVKVVRVVNGTPTDITILLGKHDTFNTLVSRFKIEKNVETTVQEIAITNETAYILHPNSSFILPPHEPQTTNEFPANYPSTPTYPDTLFEIKVYFKILRNTDGEDRTDPSFVNEESVKFSQNAIAPLSQKNTSGQLTLTKFAENLELAFANTLKVGIGKKDDLSEGQKSSKHLWAVYFGAQGISKVEIQSDTPNYFAIKPLARQLITRNEVEIKAYNKGLLGASKKQNFKSIDLEAWANQFLASVDLFLSAPYSVPAYKLEGTDFGNPSQKLKGGYQRVVAAKQLLANSISQGLDYVLAGNIDQTKLDLAQESLKEQLLVNLSNAFGTDALLQYDVDVQASYPNAGSSFIAPRLNGKPVNRICRTGTADSIATIATSLNITQIYLATQIKYFTGILNTGLEVTFNGTKHELLSSDTLGLLVLFYTTDLAALIAGLTWANPTQQGLFAANTVINITGVQLTTNGKTFEQASEFFNASVNSIAQANSSFDGIFKLGVNIPYQSRIPIKVDASNNSLDKMATAFGTPVITAEDLAGAIRDTADLLNPTFIFHAVQLMADYNITTGKTALKNGMNHVSFLLSVQAEREHRNVLMGLNYVVNEIEYDIANLTDIKGYQASDWLTFLIPIGSSDNKPSIFETNLGQPEVPIPLRTYPAMPAITAQNNLPAVADGDLPKTFPENVKKAREWKFNFNYVHTEAQQDTSYISVFFNRISDTESFDHINSGISGNAGTQFFDALAQFIAVLPNLETDLSSLLANGGNTSEQAAAINIFAELVTEVATKWTFSLNTGTNPAPTEGSYEYSLESTVKKGGYKKQPTELYDTIILKQQQPAISPSGDYPTIYWMDTSVTPPIANKLAAAIGTKECIYTYEQDVPAFQTIEHQIEFDQLNVLVNQNALGGAFIRRNERLVDTPTSTSFIYQTPEVVYNQILVPYLLHNQEIPFKNSTEPINPECIGKTGLEQALCNLFAELLDDKTKTPNIKVAAMYGYELVAVPKGGSQPLPAGALEAIISLLPITFRPLVKISDTVISNLATSVNTWESNKPISKNGGSYVFDLCIFSTLDTKKIQPILELKKLVYKIN
ncbi:MAG: LysM repeat protein [Flavobacteriales bacterium]